MCVPSGATRFPPYLLGPRRPPLGRAPMQCSCVANSPPKSEVANPNSPTKSRSSHCSRCGTLLPASCSPLKHSSYSLKLLQPPRGPQPSRPLLLHGSRVSLNQKHTQPATSNEGKQPASYIISEQMKGENLRARHPHPQTARSGTDGPPSFSPAIGRAVSSVFQSFRAQSKAQAPKVNQTTQRRGPGGARTSVRSRLRGRGTSGGRGARLRGGARSRCREEPATRRRCK
jgi:hypothetical protein